MGGGGVGGSLFLLYKHSAVGKELDKIRFD